MGLFKEVAKTFYSPWDDSKIICRHVPSSKGNPPPCFNSDVDWICVNCLEAYCDQHGDNLVLYEPDLEGISGFAVSDYIASKTLSGLSEADKRRDDLIHEQIEAWYTEVTNRVSLRIDEPADWGAMTAFSDGRYSSQAFVLCETCASRVKPAEAHKKMLEIGQVTEAIRNWEIVSSVDKFRHRLGDYY